VRGLKFQTDSCIVAIRELGISFSTDKTVTDSLVK